MLKKDVPNLRHGIAPIPGNKQLRVQTISRIIIPVALPGVVTTVIFAFISAWNEFVFALTFVFSDAFKPLTVAIPSFIGQYGTQWQLLMAAALLATVPVRGPSLRSATVCIVKRVTVRVADD